jgi:hypothetical protein
MTFLLIELTPGDIQLPGESFDLGCLIIEIKGARWDKVWPTA